MLVLPITKKWFEMIVAGEKKEEYREIKPYYDKRFMKTFGFDYLNKRIEVIFRNGYSLTSPSVKCLCILNKGYGKQEWGAVKDKEYYILTIIKIIEIKNWKPTNLKKTGITTAMETAMLPATAPITVNEEMKEEIMKELNKQLAIGVDIGANKSGQAIKNTMMFGA